SNASTLASASPQTKLDVPDVLYQRDAVLDAFEVTDNFTTIEDNNIPQLNENQEGTTQGPSLEQKLTEESSTGDKSATAPFSTEKPCTLDCGPGGFCVTRGQGEQTCSCPLAKVEITAKKSSVKGAYYIEDNRNHILFFGEDVGDLCLTHVLPNCP
ncbi:hypothetical protein HHI36_024022, partial [Cryptolaemus montrouzieri]